MFKRKPKDPKWHRKSGCARYDCGMFAGGKHGMILAYGVLEANGMFYEVQGAGNREELTAKVILDDGELAYLPMTDFERYTVMIEYR